MCLRAASVEWNVPGKYGPHGESFSFFMKKEPATMPGSETFSSFFATDIHSLLFLCWCPQEVRASCPALDGGRGNGESGCQAPDLGDARKFGCPKSPMWESEGEAWSEDESVSSSVPRESNVCNDALHVIGLHGPGDKVSLFL